MKILKIRCIDSKRVILLYNNCI